MGRKDRELSISGLSANADLKALTAIFSRFGPCKDVFFIHGSTSNAIVCFEKEEHVPIALRGTSNLHFEGRRLRVYQQGKKKGSNGNGAFSSSTTGWGNNAASTSTSASQLSSSNNEPALAPGPRPVDLSAIYGKDNIPAALASASASTSTSAAAAAADGAEQRLDNLVLDTWELSLYDSDYDDGFVPMKIKKRPVEIKRDEWEEAYDLVRSFAHHGGAIMAVDVESWDQNSDYIIEVGLAKVEWQAKNGTQPWCKSEHLIVKEHESKRNGIYSPDAKNKFAFGKSKYLNEHEIAVRLRFFMRLLSREQPLVLLFHNAAAEISYFEQMNISLAEYPERVPRALLEDFADGKAHRGELRSSTLILDTQRLYKSFTYGTEEAYKDPHIALGKMAKRLGIEPKFLHNAGNDAQYTLEVFMAMVDRENAKRRGQQQQQARM